jgi:hypothetical protein
MPGMTREEVLALLDRRSSAWAARDVPALAATHTADGVVVSPVGGVLEGRAEIERVYRLWLAAFPDIATQPLDVVIEDARLVQLVRFSGTHLGDFFGMPPTNRHVDFDAALLMTLRDGLVAEERRVYDFTGLLVQVGVIRAKPMA